MKHNRHRAVLLPTALFLVLLLFGLVTAIHMLTLQDMRVTRYAHAKTRALYRARAAIDKLLFCLDNPQSPLAQDVTHNNHSAVAGLQILQELDASNARNPLQVRLDDSWVPVWSQPSADPATPNLKILLALGRDGGQEQPAHLAYQDVPKVDGVLYLRIGGESGHPNQASTYYYRKRSEAEAAPADQWHVLPAVPNTYWVDAPTLHMETPPLAPYARNAHSPAADDRGNLFVLLRRAGIHQLDTVQRYDGALNQWKPLPPVPALAYKVQQGQVNRVPTAPVRLQELASNGGDRLYVRWANGSRPDTFYWINPNDPADNWHDDVPAAPQYIYDLHGNRQPHGGYAYSLQEISCDAQSNLYARWPRGGVDTLYRYDAQSRTWGTIKPPPRTYFRRIPGGDGAYEPVTPTGGQVAANLRYLQADRTSNTLVAILTRDGVDTIYDLDLHVPAQPQSSSQPIEVSADWKIRYPAPGDYYRLNGQQAQSPAAAGVRQATFDGSGVLYFRWSREGVDSLFGYDNHSQNVVDIFDPQGVVSNDGRFKILAHPPSNAYDRRFSGAGTQNFHWPVRMDIPDLAGGGLPVAGQFVMRHGEIY